MMRQGLQSPIPLTLIQVDNFAYSNIGADLLENLGKVIRIHPEVNGFYGLRAAMILAASEADSEGWTLLDVLRQFPSATIDVPIERLLQLRQNITVYSDYNQAVVAAIQTQAQIEAQSQPQLDPIPRQDFSQPGPYGVTQRIHTISNPALRQTGQGIQVNYDFSVDGYWPQGLGRSAPIIIVSHGFGSTQAGYRFIAEHLASHGYVVLVPNHVGSNLRFRNSFLAGLLNTAISPAEFVSRPQEISFLIDELERLVATSPEWAAQLNLNQIGVLGDSLGAATVLGLAGANLNFAHLAAACDQELPRVNIALYL
jgi:hypothetical protein